MSLKDPRQEIVDCLTEPFEFNDWRNKESVSFIYLIHGLNSEVTKSKENIKRRLNDLRDPNYLYNASLIGNLHGNDKSEFYPDYDPTRELIRRTWFSGNTGLIISSNPEDIKVSWYEDMSTPTNLDAG